MKRKDFITKGFFGTGFFVTSSASAFNIMNDIDELDPLEPMNILGFNHLPFTNSKLMSNKILFKADSRGIADHGWLKSRHSFSFASYYNPERMHFGALRVLNDDIIEGGTGFGTHPHDNMEIISIPLEGDLEHKDSMGNTTIIQHGEIQVMSAGRGIKHSEYNRNPDKLAKFLQIWIFPDKKGVEPRYDQMKLDLADRENKLQQILSPNPNDEGVWIHQNAWFHIGKFKSKKEFEYKLRDKNNGVYIFNINGKFAIESEQLNDRDAMGIWNIDSIKLKSLLDESEVLIIEVPMTV